MQLPNQTSEGRRPITNTPQRPKPNSLKEERITASSSIDDSAHISRAILENFGLIFYISPGTVISYWPWPVKALAVRFLGAIFLAISLGCWSALQAKLWQRAKILVLVGGSFFGLTGIVSIVRGVTVSSGTTIWLWTGYFLAAGAGCLILVKMYGWHKRQPEVSGRPIALRLSRIFFGIQTSVVGIFGIMMILLPGLAQDQFWPWKVATPTLQTFGALFLATLALLAVGISWSVIVAETPSALVTSVWLFLYSFVAAGSTLLYIIIRRRYSVPQ